MASTSINTAKRYVQLAERRQELEAELKSVKKTMTDLEEGLIEYFQRHSLRNLGAGDRTVYLHRQVFASLPDKVVGREKLREHGFGDLVESRVMPNRLSAWVREMMEKAEESGEAPISSGSLSDMLPVPQEVRDVLRVTEKFSVRVRRS